MFDSPLPGVSALPELSPAELVDAARGWARWENAACAHKLATMAEIFSRRTGLAVGDRESWWLDPEAAVAAELAAALNVTTAMALSQTHRGVALRDRLPKVADLFEAGLIGEILARAIVSRTDLILDPAALAAVDTDLAAQITHWGARSAAKTERAIDEAVNRHDPGALRQARESHSSPDVAIGAPTDAPGFTTLWARLFAADAALIDKCLQETAYTVCERDPRSPGERLAAAMTARITGTELVCGCGTDDCDAATGRGGAEKNTTIYIVADPDTIAAAHANTTDNDDDGDGDGGGDGDNGDGGDGGEGDDDDGDDGGDGGDGGDDGDRPDGQPDENDEGDEGDADRPGGEPAGEPGGEPGGSGNPGHDAPARDTPEPDVAECRPAPPAFVFGAGIVPTPLLSGMLERARYRTVTHPGAAAAEPRYTPSRALADFIRCRDLTCRFPGCDKPATDADIDHTVAYPAGPTHPSNLKCLCRFHHLLKTFWNGEHGWRDRQLPDGTIIWTSPTGHTYTTHPGSATLFPALCKPTPVLWDGDPPEPATTCGRGAMMPRRRHTRASNRAHRITAERRLNNDHVTEQTRPPPF